MQPLYGARFVAFVDILGFKSMVQTLEMRTAGSDGLFRRVKSVLNFLNEESQESDGQHDLLVYEAAEQGIIEKELGDPVITYVSDCMIVSAEGTFDGFKSLCNKLTKFSTDLACDGMFLRGALAYGPLYHDRKFVFGSAYQTAYQLETTVANVPRIVIDRSALDRLRAFEGKFPLTEAGTRTDSDGLRYLNLFPLYYNPQYTFDWIGFLLRVKGHILWSLNMFDGRVSGFPAALKELDRFYCWREHAGEVPDFTCANDAVLSKYIWIKDEFNRTLERHAPDLLNAGGEMRISPIVDLGSHWGPSKVLGHRR
jgi:hypothetical protein